MTPVQRCGKGVRGSHLDKGQAELPGKKGMSDHGDQIKGEIIGIGFLRYGTHCTTCSRVFHSVKGCTH